MNLKPFVWFVALTALGIGGFVVGLCAGQFPALGLERGALIVIDGDTIEVRGEPMRTRLVGFNAPETSRDRARCSAERRLGLAAKARLREIVAGGNLSLERVPCACPPGTEGTEACNYGRRCAVLRSGGRDVGAMLISEGLAVPYVCGRTACGAPPSPWCRPP